MNYLTHTVYIETGSGPTSIGVFMPVEKEYGSHLPDGEGWVSTPHDPVWTVDGVITDAAAVEKGYGHEIMDKAIEEAWLEGTAVEGSF